MGAPVFMHSRRRVPYRIKHPPLGRRFGRRAWRRCSL